MLGASTTVTNSSSSVSYGNDGTSDTFVKSYPGATNKLETTSIKGVGSDITFNAVSGTPGTVTATNTVLGTATEASKIVTESKTATNTVLGTATTASKATAGTAVSVAKTGTTVQNVVTSSNAISSLVTAATYDSNTETVSFSYINSGLGRSDITPAASNGTITPYTFADVTVPVISSNDSVSVASVKTNTAVSVPVISSNDAVTASAQITVASKTAATAAASATTVATGSLKANDTAGATILTGLGTATTASAITGLPTATAAAQTATVDQSHLVTAMTSNDITFTVDQDAKVIKQ